MLTDPAGALAREHVNDLLASAARHDLAREARRAHATAGRCGSWPRRLLAAARGGAPCDPATAPAC